MDIFDKIKQTLRDLARSRNVSDAELHDDWSLNYKRDNDDSFISDVLALSELMRVHRGAMNKGDLLTARCALIEAQGFAHNLSSFFWSMKEDILRASDESLNQSGDATLDWPALPERYVYPVEYGYRDPERVVFFGSERFRWDPNVRRWLLATHQEVTRVDEP